jgi:hypothetical protein
LVLSRKSWNNKHGRGHGGHQTPSNPPHNCLFPKTCEK